MRFLTTAITTLLILPALFVRVTYDSTYDNATNSLDIVACSNGVNGIETKA
ncbi:hypothetical protein EUX98_g6270 [Antrodiella citrinella]|uniref:Uncharacterized protein n=1 Tax=Antrodiella citrinella TaxID=2447956 RepID=A0A4S4MPE7_9APHY|nr:hypothetical protein EUX98_g6270 [Antrodiella citrinella]